jgi:hypothetical protein
MPSRPHTRTRALAVAAAVVLAGGCNEVWNASDLAVWVRDQAAEQGCERETVVLDEWYTEEPEGNVWHGSCRNRETGEEMRFGINVDSVWKPSSG